MEKKRIALSNTRSYNNNYNNNNNCLMVLSSDCNSNPPAVPQQQSVNLKSNGSLPVDDPHQWSIEYIRNRDDSSGTRMHTSILSMCGPPQSTNLSYDDLSRNIDANLAEIDMETFRSEDINSILALPTIYCASDEYQSEKNGEKAASVSASLLDNLASDENYGGEAQSNSSGAESTEVMSICKSEPLFSPVKEQLPLPPNTVSADSLDCESFDEQQELIISCQANKENYTIAFEGSCTHISEDSDYHDADPSGSENDSTTWSHTLQNLPTTSSSSSMVQSDYVFTSWRKLRNGKEVVNHNVSSQGDAPSVSNVKTRSMPNLARKNSIVMSGDQSRISQLMESSGSGKCMKLFDIQGNPMTLSKTSDSSSQHSFSLVRLFVQNKTSPESDQQKQQQQYLPNPKVAAIKGQYLSHNNGNSTEEDDSESFEDSLVDDGRPQHSKKPSTMAIMEEHHSTADEMGDDHFDSFKPSKNGSCHVYQLPKSTNSFKCYSNQSNNGYNQSQGTQTRKHRSSNGSSESLTQSGFCESISNKTSVFQRRSSRVVIAKTRSVGTQVPIPVSDQCIQTIADPNAEFNTSVIADQPKIYEIPAHMYNSVCSNSGSGSGTDKRSIYVCYPNYSLPDLSFLATSAHSLDRFLLKPTRRVTPVRRSRSSEGREQSHLRPKSMGDADSYNKNAYNLDHIHDLESLKFLLPEEYQEMILGSSNSSQWSSTNSRGSSQASDCQQCKLRNSSEDIPPLVQHRSRSHLTNESRKCSNSADDDLPPPLPPKRSISLPGVPKGILRKQTNRYSMCDLRKPEPKTSKRASLQEPLGIVWEKCLNMTPEMQNNLSQALEFVEELSEMPSPADNNLMTSSCSCQRPSEGFTGSGSTPDSVFTASNRSFGRSSPEQRHGSDLSGSYRSKKTVSFSENIKNGRGLNYNGCGEDYAQECDISPTRDPAFIGVKNAPSLDVLSSNEDKVIIDLKKMQDLTKAVTTVADSLVTYCSQILNFKSEFDSSVTKIIVNDLCPRLYTLLSYGMLPNLKSMFGNVQNSLWRVIEVSSPLTGPTKPLHDLVLHVNSNEDINTALKKFSAFVLGLLNIHSLDSWLTYLRLKEKVIEDHYDTHSFMLLSSTITKNMYDKLLHTLQPLSVLPFKLDMQVVCKINEPKQIWTSSYLNRTMSSSKSDESLSSLLSQARELRKAISQTSRTFQASRPLSQVHDRSPNEYATKTRPKSFADFSADKMKTERVVVKPMEKQSPQACNTSQTDEERIKQAHVKTESTKPSYAKAEQKVKPKKADSKVNKILSKYVVPKDNNKSDEVKFSELKKKWELLSNDQKKKQPAAAGSERKASKLPTSPTKHKAPPAASTPSSSASKLAARKSMIPLPRSSSNKSSNLPVLNKKNSMSRQISCPTRVSNSRKFN